MGNNDAVLSTVVAVGILYGQYIIAVNIGETSQNQAQCDCQYASPTEEHGPRIILA